MKITGHFVQLVERMHGRIMYSCYVPGVSRQLFEATWKALGESIYASLNETEQTRLDEYELRISPEYR